MKLSDALRMARAAKKLSQRQVAEHLGLKQQAVSEWEKGGGVDQKHWAGIKELLDVDVSAYSRPMLTNYAMDALNSRVEFLTAIDQSQNIPIDSKDDSQVNVNVTHNNNTAPPQSGKYVLELSAKEYEAVTLYRKYGNETYLDKCLDKLRRVRDILSR